MALVLGSLHGLVPLASPTKLRTAIGVSFSRSWTVMSPIEVLKWAYSPSGRAAAGGFAGGVWGACANAATPVTISDNSNFDMKCLHPSNQDSILTRFAWRKRCRDRQKSEVRMHGEQSPF